MPRLKMVTNIYQWENVISSITDQKFAEQCLEIIKADANIYDHDIELIRLASATRLIAHGMNKEHVLEALEKQAEHLIEAMF